jgi:hypothetical protein
MKIFGYNINKQSKELPEIAQKTISTEQIKAVTTGIIDDLVNRVSYITLNSSAKRMQAWQNIADVRLITNKLASFFNNVKIKHYKQSSDGLNDISENSALIELLKRPNLFQSQQEFFERAYSIFNIDGNAFIKSTAKYSGAENDYTKIKNLVVLNPAFLNIEIENKEIYNIESAADYIKKIEYNENNNRIPLFYHELIHINNTNIENNRPANLVGNSVLNAAKTQVSNLSVAYEAKNVLLTKRGALGIFSMGSGANPFPLSPDEKERLQKEYAGYGLSHNQWQVIFTRASLVWQQISMNARDLMIFEGLEDDRKILCGLSGLPYLLFENGGANGATFANMDVSHREVYSGKIIPDWLRFEVAFNNFFKLKEKKELLKFEYSHIPALQENAQIKVQTNKIQSEGMTKILTDFNSGVITYDQAYSLLSNIWEIPESEIITLLKYERVIEQEESGI